jgi:hypothetical protein
LIVEFAVRAEKHAVTLSERSKLIKLSCGPRNTEQEEVSEEMKINETAAVIPADSVAKGG